MNAVVVPVTLRVAFTKLVSHTFWSCFTVVFNGASVL